MPKTLVVFDTPENPQLDIMMFALQTSLEEKCPDLSPVFERREPREITSDIGKMVGDISKRMAKDMRADKTMDLCIHLAPRSVVYPCRNKEVYAPMILSAAANRRRLIAVSLRLTVDNADAEIAREVLVATAKEITRSIGKREITDEENRLADRISDAVAEGIRRTPALIAYSALCHGAARPS